MPRGLRPGLIPERSHLFYSKEGEEAMTNKAREAVTTIRGHE